jgi:hypothetical protein
VKVEIDRQPVRAAVADGVPADDEEWDSSLVERIRDVEEPLPSRSQNRVLPTTAASTEQSGDERVRTEFLVGERTVDHSTSWSKCSST